MSERSKETTEAISALLLNEPFWASLLFDLLEVVETQTLPGGSQLNVAATDGSCLFINPDKFGKFSVQERCGVIAHEILHVVMQHPARMRAYWELGIGPDAKPFSGKRFNIAADYIINAQLIANGFKLPLGSLQNSQIGADDIVDEVYHKVPEDEDDEDNWDSHEMGAPDAPATQKPQLQAALQKAAAMAKMQGKGVGGMGRLIQEICEPQITWQEHLRIAMVTTAAGNDTHTWSRPNRRKLAVAPHLYLPGRTGLQSPQGCVVIDTSGSIGETELKVFLGELQGILSDLQPELVHVMYIDSELHGDVHEISDTSELLDLGAKAGGGGGTNMPKAFEIANERQLDIQWMVILTDGYTPFGEQPPYPVIWASTTDQKAPWGETVHVKVPVGA